MTLLTLIGAAVGVAGMAGATTTGASPIGSFEWLTRASSGTNLVLRGWTIDPDTTKPLTVLVTLDGKAARTVVARVARPDVAKRHPKFGALHGISAQVSASAGEHRVCLTARNIGGGHDLALGCRLVIAVHPKVTSAPRSVHASATYGAARVTWVKPAGDGGAPPWAYTVTAAPGGRAVMVSGLIGAATVSGLSSHTRYTFSVRAVNVAGSSSAGRSNAVTTPSGPPPQKTPAPVSTSRYVRNIRGSSAAELARMRSEGYADARANPSGHAYLMLLDIGGQDGFDGGVVLSATTRFVSYGNLARDLAAYLDGYHRGQRSNAPATIAIGTNNDMDVSASTGRAWATRVVNPLVSHAAGWSQLHVAGANDIEPGFRATYTQTRSWLSGYLAASRAPFVFNGSADGCAWTATNRRCNNGWSMYGLYTLAAGAAPTRTLNLPQIYNTTMASQWKYISLTGVARNQPRIRFGGPLTEWTACAQAHSCGSLTGKTAWATLWRALNSHSLLRVGSLPYATDLRIDR